ncbi:hypothetical protein [Olleya sp. Bg11-27]|uniref:hypothetical protein n=1 Tax=Olleya sp. Bg11-27 TaxID=2058135 RepID=UPI0026D500B6|nr:hypothetical protein [Olleya sp. Bg11-27]
MGPMGPVGPTGLTGADGPQGPAGVDGAAANLLTIVTASSITLSDVNQLVITSGTVIISLPPNPSNGQQVYIYADGSNTSVNPNGHAIRTTGTDFNNTTATGGPLRIYYASATGKWYVL